MKTVFTSILLILFIYGNAEASRVMWKKSQDVSAIMPVVESWDVVTTGHLTADSSITTSGFVGIGLHPTTNLHVGHAKLNEQAQFYHETYSTGGADYSRIRLRKSNTNTLGALVETDNVDILGSIYFSGVNSSSGWSGGARIYAAQNAASGATYIPGYMALGGSSAATGTWSTLYLSDDDKVGIRVADPTVALDVLGDMLLTGSLTATGTLGAGAITGTSFTDGVATLSGGNLTGMGNITGADVDISAGTGDITTTGTGQFTGLGVNAVPDADQRIKVVAKATDGIVLNIDGSTNDFTGTGNNFQRALFFSRDLNAGDGNEPDNLYTFSTQLNPKHTDAVLDNNNKNYILYESTLTDTATWSNDSANDRYVFDYASYALLNIDGSYGSTGAGFINLTTRGYRAKIDVDNEFTATGGATNQMVNYGLYSDMNINPTLSSGALSVTNYGNYIDLVGTATGTSSNYGLYMNRVTGADSNYDMRSNTGEDWWWDADYQKLIIGEGLDSHIQFKGSALEIMTNKVTVTDDLHIQTDKFVLYDQDSSDKTEFHTNDDGNLVIEPDSRTIHLGNATDGDSQFLFYGDSYIYGLYHDEDNGNLQVSANDLTNYSKFSADGGITFEGTAKVLRSKTFTFNYATVRANGKPTQVARGVFQGFSLPIYAADDEELFTCQCIPDDWDGTGDPVVNIAGWLDTANNAKKFNLQVSVEWYDPTQNDVVPITTNDYTTETTTGNDAQYTSYVVSFTLDASAIGVLPHMPLGIRVRRLAASGDEIAGEFVVEGLVIDYLSDKIGKGI